jgi:hypothetical protein
MDAIQAIVDAALEVVRQRRGETPSSGDAGDPLERLVQAVEAYEQQGLAGPRDVDTPLPSLHADTQDSEERQEQLALALLYAHGWIHDPKGKAKSVVFTPEGEAYAHLLAERYFGPSDESADC